MASRSMKLAPLPPVPPASSEAVRSSMVGNKSKSTRLEIKMRETLSGIGIDHFVLHPALPGTPDIAFCDERVAVFVHGCFWHRCPYCSPHIPNRNQEYWLAKFNRNQARDKRNIAELRRMGWSIVVVWECKFRKNPRRQAQRVKLWLSKNRLL